MKVKVFRIMAYVYMPFLFTLLGYGIFYIAAEPGIQMLEATGGMVLSEEIPDFSQEFKSIFAPEENKQAPPQQEKGSEPNPTVNYAADTEEAAPPENVVSVKDIQFPEYGTMFAELSCDRIKLLAPVYWGDTNEVLKVGVGQFMGSFLPGFQRTILLSGHNTTFFKPLEKMREGDEITILTNYGEFKYQISEINILHSLEAKNMMDKLLSYEDEKLIMYTCYPFETLVGTKEERLFLFADKISGPTVQ